MLTIDKVKKAELLLKDVVRKTDLIYATALSKNADIYLKSENLQKTGSFKVRGAYAKIAQLSAEQKKTRNYCLFGRQPCTGSCAVCSKKRHRINYIHTQYSTYFKNRSYKKLRCPHSTC